MQNDSKKIKKCKSMAAWRRQDSRNRVTNGKKRWRRCKCEDVTQTLWHTDALAEKRFYTQAFLHTDAITYKHFCTQALHTSTFTRHGTRLCTWESSRLCTWESSRLCTYNLPLLPLLAPLFLLPLLLSTLFLLVLLLTFPHLFLLLLLLPLLLLGPLLHLLSPLFLLPLLLSALLLLLLLLLHQAQQDINPRCHGSPYIKCNKIQTLKLSWLFLHQLQQDLNPKGVVSLLTSSATRYKP